VQFQVVVLLGSTPTDVLEWIKLQERFFHVVDRRLVLPIEVGAIATLARHCPQLVSVSFSVPQGFHPPWGMDGITDGMVEILASACPALQTLDFSGCNNLTDRSVVQLAQCCPRLSAVDFSGCTELTDKSITALTASKINLKSVKLNKCDCLTLKGLTELIASMSDLTSVESDRGTWAVDCNVDPDHYPWSEPPSLITRESNSARGTYHLRTIRSGRSVKVPTAWAVMLVERCPALTSITGCVALCSL
jgi:hypothetical protein